MPVRVDDDSLFAKAFDAAPVSLTITSLATGRLLHVNGTFERITGYSREEAIGKTTVELGLWANRADREAELAAVAALGRLQNLEYRFRARDGHEIIGLLSAQRLDLAGEPCALTLIEDITASKRVEEDLRRSHQRLVAIATATSSILASPEPGAVTAATITVARDVFSADGYALWRYDGSAGWRVVDSHGISEAFTARILATNAGRRVRGELESPEPLVVEDIATAPLLADLRDAYAADGIVSMVVFPLIIRGHGTGSIVFYFRQPRVFSEPDIHAGRALANIAAAALATAEVYASASDANRLKDDFLATLSHELRTPLNAVMGYARMLRSGVIPADRMAPALETLERNATSLSRIIEDVLDISRIVSGRLRLTIRPVDLAALVSQCIETVQPTANAKGVALEVTLAADMPAIEADVDRLQQMVWNLLTNALKFTPSGGRVRLTATAADGHVSIVVSDTGVGIAREFLPFVFDRFRQGDPTFAREHGGLGLGLAIARHIAELHGGTIRAESDGAGRGATFTVALPRAIQSLAGLSPNR